MLEWFRLFSNVACYPVPWRRHEATTSFLALVHAASVEARNPSIRMWMWMTAARGESWEGENGIKLLVENWDGRTPFGSSWWTDTQMKRISCEIWTSGEKWKLLSDQWRITWWILANKLSFSNKRRGESRKIWWIASNVSRVVIALFHPWLSNSKGKPWPTSFKHQKKRCRTEKKV